MRNLALLGALIGGLFWYFLHSFQSGLDEARPLIVKESFENAKKLAASESSNHSDSASNGKNVVNANITNATRTPAQARGKLKADGSSAFTDTDDSGNHFWCRDSSHFILSERGECMYTGSCFSCDDGSIIPPEAPGAQPFCSTGSFAKVFDIACCPRGIVDGRLDCPAAPECLREEAPGSCSCNGNPECRYMVGFDGKYACQCPGQLPQSN